MRRLNHIVLLLLGLCSAGSMAAQSLHRIELFLDGDPGYGLATAFTDVHVDGNELTFDLAETAHGAHILYVRAQDTEGRWSATMSRPLFIDRYQDIVYVEYFFDTDPGVGNANAVQLPDQAYKGNLQLNLDLDIDGLSLGEHELFVRARDRYDQWTDVMSRRFEVVKKDDVTPDPPQPVGDFACLEYFFDTDPGYGLGRRLATPRLGSNTYVMDFTDVPDGAHVLYLRAQDTNGTWSATMSRPLYVFRPAGKVVAVEYFFDGNDPGEGLAQSAPVPDDTDSAFAFDVSIEGLEVGDHQFSLRARDDRGRWSLLRSEPFFVEDEGTGILTARRLMPVSIEANGRSCILSADADGLGDSQVTVTTTAGVRLATSAWPKGQSQLAVPVNVTEGTVLIVSVEDQSTHRRLVQKIIAR